MAKERNRLAATMLLLLAVCLVVVPSAAAQSTSGQAVRRNAAVGPDKVTGEVMVVLKSAAVADKSVAVAEGLAASVGGTVRQHIVDEASQSDFYLLQVASGQEAAAAVQLSKDAQVLSADPNYYYQAFDLASGQTASQPNLNPNDPYYTQYQWDMVKIGMPRAWAVWQSAAAVAVIDTGIDLGHPEFSARIAGGVDYSGDNSAGGQDNEGHGSHVAGTIGGNGNNGTGIAGMAWLGGLLAVKALNSGGSGTNSAIVQGIDWARTHGAQVINMSLGGPNYSQAMQDAVIRANNAGILVVAAAGNEADTGNPTSYPCAYAYVICVGATGPTDNWAYYSNHGSYVLISAPGGDPHNGDPVSHFIVSTLWRGSSSYYPTSGYGAEAGTSMAAPHVAGLLAMLKSKYPGRPSDFYINRMISTAVDLGTPGRDEYFGYGRIDAGCALEMAFNDVGCNYWAYNYVQWLAASGISSGDANGNFSPGANTRRDEFAKFIVKAAGWPLVSPATPSFSDVPSSSPFYQYIETAKARNVINGIGGRFNPASPIRRDEMAKMVVLARAWTLVNPSSPTFSDVPSSNIFYQYVETAANHGVVNGNGGLYSPSGLSTRAQMSKVLYNAYH